LFNPMGGFLSSHVANIHTPGRVSHSDENEIWALMPKRGVVPYFFALSDLVRA
jgi:hypothetical protein